MTVTIAASPAPAVSVVLCIYNDAEYLAAAVESVFRQTFTDWELVIVDNGSTDATPSILAQYLDDRRVRLIRHDRNDNITRRLNEAISATRGPLISILYGDDEYLERKLERQVAEFAELSGDYGVVYGPGLRVNVDTGRTRVEARLGLSGDVSERLLVARRVFINPISPLVRRVCFERYPFHEDVFVEGEGIFWRIALDWKFHYVDEPLVLMRDHRGNIGHAVALMADCQMRILDHLVREPRFPRRFLPHVDYVRAATMQNLGWWALRIANDGARAREAFRQAIRWQRGRSASPRIIAGWLLSLLPNGALARLNGFVNAVRKPDVHLDFKSDYS